MGAPNRFQPVVSRCRWVADERELFGRVPELQAYALPVESWSVGTQGQQWVSPVTGILSMAGPLVETLEQARTTDVSTFVNAGNEVIEADGLVAHLLGALQDMHSNHAHRLVMGVAHLSASILKSGQVPSGIEPAVARRASDLAAMLDGQAPMERATLMAKMASAVSARMAAALSRSPNSPNSLTALLVANQLVWVLPHNAFDPRNDLALVSRIVDVDLDPSVVTMVSQIARHAIEQSHSRLGGRKEKPADSLVDQLGRLAHGDLLLHPRTGPVLLRLMPHLTDARSLKGVVKDHKLAARYLEPNAVRTVSGAWEAMLRELSVWDALSAAMAGIEFVSASGGLFRLDGQVLDASARWSMRTPRADRRQAHAVVACRFSNLIGQGGAQPTLRRGLHSRWNESLPSGAVHSVVADHGIAVFQRAADAIRFAIKVRSGFVGSGGMLEVDGEPVAVAPGSHVALGVSFGHVVGGTDGESSWLDGPAVSEAIHLAGRGAPTSLMYDPLQIRNVGTGEWGLMSNGICCSRPAATAAWNDWGAGVHRFSDGSEVGGLSRDFQTYPVDGWAQVVDGVALFISVGPSRGAPILEVLGVDATMLRELQSRDIQLTEGEGIIDDEEPSVELADEDDPFGFEGSEEPSVDNQSLGSQWTDIGFGDESESER